MRQKFNENQQLSPEDLNKISSRLQADLYDGLLSEILAISPSSIYSSWFIADGFKVVRTSATQVRVTAGLGLYRDSTQPEYEPKLRLMKLVSDKFFGITIPSTYRREDIIVVKVGTKGIARETRRVKKAGSLSIEEEQIDTATDWAVDIRLIKGVERASTSTPATPDGYTKISTISPYVRQGILSNRLPSDHRQKLRNLESYVLDLENAKTELQAKIDTTDTELKAKIDTTETELQAKIDTTDTELKAKIDTTETELKAKIDTTDTGRAANTRVQLNRELTSLKQTTGLNPNRIDYGQIAVGKIGGIEYKTRGELGIPKEFPDTAIISGRTSTESSSPRFLRLWNDNVHTHRFKVMGATTPLVVMIDGTQVVIDNDILYNFTSSEVSAMPGGNIVIIDMNQNEIGDGYRLGEEDYVAKAGYAGRINIRRHFKSSIWSGQGTEGDTGKRFQFIHGKISAFQSRWFDGNGEIFTCNVFYSGWLRNCLRGIARGGNSTEDKLLESEEIGGKDDRRGSTGVELLNMFQVYVDKSKNISIYNSQSRQQRRGKCWIGVIYAGIDKVRGYTCGDFHKDFSNLNTYDLKHYGNGYYLQNEGEVSVYGTLVRADVNKSTGSFQDPTSASYRAGETARTGFYALYAREDGTYVYSQSRPIYRRDLKGYYHREETWRALLDDLVTIRSGRSSGAQKNSLMPWQKYSSIGFKPTTLSYNITYDSRKGSYFDANSGLSEFPLSIRKEATGRVLISYKFANNLQTLPSIWCTSSNINSFSYNYKVLGISALSLTNFYVSIYSSIGTARGLDTSFSLTISLLGLDLKQVMLDNSIGK